MRGKGKCKEWIDKDIHCLSVLDVCQKREGVEWSEQVIKCCLFEMVFVTGSEKLFHSTLLVIAYGNNFTCRTKHGFELQIPNLYTNVILNNFINK